MTAAIIQEVAAHTEAADDARRAGFDGLASAHDALAFAALRPALRTPRPARDLCPCGNHFADYCNPARCDIGE